MDTNEIITQRFATLPKDIREAILNTDLAGKFNTISSKHNLHVDQNGALQTETLLVMIGLERTDDYVDNLQKNLNITKSEAFAIADEVNKEIFNSIRSALQEMQAEFIDDENEAVTDDRGEVGTNESRDDNTVVEPKQDNTRDKVEHSKPLTPTPSIITPTTPVTVLSQKPSAYDLSPKPATIDPKPIERAGDFVVDIMPKPSNQYKEASINRESVLKSIEDPNVDLVDHMLTSPVASTAIVETKKIEATGDGSVQTPAKPVQKTPTPVINKSYGIDPYRESI